MASPSALAASADTLSRWALLRRNLAAQDYILLAFHAYLLVRVLMAPDSAQAVTARLIWSGLCGITALGIVLGRAELLRPPWLRALIYRLCVFVPVPASYLGLSYLLPALRPTLLDPQLLRIDELLFFGKTPAVWLQPFIRYATVEWFSFFYWSYLPILGIQLIPFLLFGRAKPMRELLVGAMLVTAIGHTLYTLVPGAGPHAAMHFERDLAVGGFFWGLVQKMVDSAGAQLDIFPSLHTALPTYFSLVSLRHRHTLPFRLTAPVIVFFTANIIIATLFLRWHYGVDVLAGLLTAWVSLGLAIRISDQEAHRADHGLQPVWEPLGKSHG